MRAYGLQTGRVIRYSVTTAAAGKRTEMVAVRCKFLVHVFGIGKYNSKAYAPARADNHWGGIDLWEVLLHHVQEGNIEALFHCGDQVRNFRNIERRE